MIIKNVAGLLGLSMPSLYKLITEEELLKAIGCKVPKNCCWHADSFNKGYIQTVTGYFKYDNVSGLWIHYEENGHNA